MHCVISFQLCYVLPVLQLHAYNHHTQKYHHQNIRPTMKRLSAFSNMERLINIKNLSIKSFTVTYVYYTNIDELLATEKSMIIKMSRSSLIQTVNTQYNSDK